MAIIIDPEGFENIKKIVGKRLKASRRASGISEADAAAAIGHKGLTQLSLAESGDRLPPILTLVQLADLYSVPIDFILGRINDPIAEEGEHREGLIARALSQAIRGCFERFSKSVSEQAAVTIAGYRDDRLDLQMVLSATAEAKEALDRLKKLNPEFEEEWRGSARLETAITRISMIGDRVAQRMKNERIQLQTVEKAIGIQDAEDRVHQFMLELKVA